MSHSQFDPALNSVAPLPKHDRTAWLKGGDKRCVMPPPTHFGTAWRVVLLGAPGIGKGVQATLLSERLGACHLCTDDVFLAVKSCVECELTPAMKNALDDRKQGATIPHESILNLVGERLHCLDCNGGFLLDGFPRTVAQAKALDQLLETNHLKLTAVFHYCLSTEEIVARVSERRICLGCHTVFHPGTRPSKTADICDQCGGKLTQSETDRPETVEALVKTYQNSTKSLIDFYQQRGLLVNISAEGTPEEIFNRTPIAARARE